MSFSKDPEDDPFLTDDDDEGGGREGPQCVTCLVRSPSTNTNYTLISTNGWRLTLTQTSDGQRKGEWRCPSCWKKFKRGSMLPP